MAHAAERVAGRVRALAVASVEAGPYGPPVHLALEHLQHTGSFKARGAYNFLAAHVESKTVPEVGVTIASGGNAGLACAWAARALGIRATVFVPATAPRVKVDRLRGYGADVRLEGSEYADALAACDEFASTSGALASHAYDHPLIAAGAGTLVDELLAVVPDVSTVVVAVGGGGLLSGVATAAAHRGVRTVAVEPSGCCALRRALDVGQVVESPVVSVASDSLGARRVSGMALATAQQHEVVSVLVDDDAIVEARAQLWAHSRLAVEHGAATALAALTSGRFAPGADERVAVVLCGANTDPSDLSPSAAR